VSIFIAYPCVYDVGKDRTPLSIAKLKGRTAIVELLKKHGGKEYLTADH